MIIKTAIGQDSHRFEAENKEKKLVLGGLIFEGEPPLKGNSDADVVLHSVTNAISGITGVNILGPIADKMCLDHGITDSREYLKEALKYLEDYRISHLSISIECLRPRIFPKISKMKESLADLLDMDSANIGITATTGEGLTDFGMGEGIQVFSIITVIAD